MTAMFEGKPKEFKTCWMCILHEFFKALEKNEVQCVCSDRDMPKIHVCKNNFGYWQFEVDDHKTPVNLS